MFITTVELGKLGENLAKDYLQKKGYKVVEQNYKTKRAEIDLVATKNNMLVFVEVRTKTSEFFGTPEETIGFFKKRKLLGNARAYVAKTKFQGPCRIDAVCIVLGENGKPARITHYENIIN